jgi:hypothetical protein
MEVPVDLGMATGLIQRWFHWGISKLGKINMRGTFIVSDSFVSHIFLSLWGNDQENDAEIAILVLEICNCSSDSDILDCAYSRGAS